MKLTQLHLKLETANQKICPGFPNRDNSELPGQSYDWLSVTLEDQRKIAIGFVVNFSHSVRDCCFAN